MSICLAAQPQSRKLPTALVVGLWLDLLHPVQSFELGEWLNLLQSGINSLSVQETEFICRKYCIGSRMLCRCVLDLYFRFMDVRCHKHMLLKSSIICTVFPFPCVLATTVYLTFHYDCNFSHSIMIVTLKMHVLSR